MALFDRDCAHGMTPITCRICNPPPAYPWPDPNAAEYARGRADALEEAARLFPCRWRPKCDPERPVREICSACE